jgi:hypothetical protein
LSIRNASSASHVRFMGPKLSVPIKVESVFHRYALIELSLDAAVRSIGFVATVNFIDEPVVLNATTVNRDGQHYYLDVIEDRTPRKLRTQGLALRALDDLGFTALEKTEADILANPLHANCDAIWKHSRDRVAPEDQFDVIHALADDGPQRLGRLALSARVSEQTILAMACADLVEIDIHDGPLSSRHMVRRRDRVRLSPPQVIASGF